MLRSGASALEAVTQSVVSLEDDGRFNAGSGALLGMDGQTVEMDAAVMDTSGKLGAVACIRAVKNPVLVARQVANTPHRLIAGQGATAFARAAGFAVYHQDNPRVRERHAQIMQELCGDAGVESEARRHQFERLWNYPMDWHHAVERYGCGTVGAVAMDKNGQFAVATSTGGCAPSLLGRVGDTPLAGCGYFAGPHGAIAATGIGEYIMSVTLSRTVYGWIEGGTPLADALQRGVELLPAHVDVGLIGVTRDGEGWYANREMPAYSISG